MVIMLKGENGKAVAGRVKQRVGEIAAKLPTGVRVTPFYDQTEVIDRTAHTVRKNLLEGSFLVVVVLFVFLRDIPATLITASIIPLAMLIGFIGMRLFGVSANLMSLGAIDFGTTDLAVAVQGSDLIVVCTPVDRIAATILDAAPHCKSGAIFTNIGTVRPCWAISCWRRSCRRPSRASRASSLCRARRFCVFGLEMLTVT